MWTKIILVFVGGAFGAIIREFFMLAVPSVGHDFPLDIFAANVTAAFILGLTFGNQRLKNVSDEFVLLVGTGVMGGMSTFSSFVFGAYSEMMATGDLWFGAIYILLSLVVGYFATLLGVRLAYKRSATSNF